MSDGKDEAQSIGCGAGQADEKKDFVPEEDKAVLKDNELDALGSDLGFERSSGESDLEYRRRMAVGLEGSDCQKCLEAVFAKKRKDWHQDEIYLRKVFEEISSEDRIKFVDDYLNREPLDAEVAKEARSKQVVFPKPCVLKNELRELMIWLLGPMAPWERDPCIGCTYCPLGKSPEEIAGKNQS